MIGCRLSHLNFWEGWAGKVLIGSDIRQNRALRVKGEILKFPSSTYGRFNLVEETHNLISVQNTLEGFRLKHFPNVYVSSLFFLLSSQIESLDLTRPRPWESTFKARRNKRGMKKICNNFPLKTCILGFIFCYLLFSAKVAVFCQFLSCLGCIQSIQHTCLHIKIYNLIFCTKNVPALHEKLAVIFNKGRAPFSVLYRRLVDLTFQHKLPSLVIHRPIWLFALSF